MMVPRLGRSSNDQSQGVPQDSLNGLAVAGRRYAEKAKHADFAWLGAISARALHKANRWQSAAPVVRRYILAQRLGVRTDNHLAKMATDCVTNAAAETPEWADLPAPPMLDLTYPRKDCPAYGCKGTLVLGKTNVENASQKTCMLFTDTGIFFIIPPKIMTCSTCQAHFGSYSKLPPATSAGGRPRFHGGAARSPTTRNQSGYL